MKPAPANLTPKARRTRASLLEAGQRLMGRHGTAGVNVMAVCAEAVVGRTSFYNYFNDVDELLEAVAMEAAAGIRAKFDHLHADQPRGRVRLKACLRMILCLAVEDAETALLLTALAEAIPDVRGLVCAEIHAELSAIGDPKIEDVEGLSSFLSITILALARQFAEGQLDKETVDRHLDRLWACVP